MPTRGALSGSLRMPLELVILSVAHASSWSSRAVIGACSWNSCSLSPVVLECVCGKEAAKAGSAPPFTCPQQWHHHCDGPRLPLHTLLAAVAPESSPSGLFLHSQPRSCPQAGPLKPELQLAAPACTSGCASQARERTAEALTTSAIRHLLPFACGSRFCALLWGNSLSVPVALPAGEGCRNLSSYMVPSQGRRFRFDPFLPLFPFVLPGYVILLPFQLSEVFCQCSVGIL